MSTADIKPKVGLALSGGGFRATLFHLGVLRRLAEMDLLRKVDVISTVSGGSIVGAAYYLELRKLLEERSRAALKADDYKGVIKQVEWHICDAIQHNLRTRLIWNPLALFWVYVSGGSFSTRMRSLYNRFLYRRILSGAKGQISVSKQGDVEWLDLRLQQAKVRDSRGEPQQDVSEINSTSENSAAKVPKLIINACCLNTGRGFRFSLSEIGGDEVGFIRTDEAKTVEQHKAFLSSVRRREPVKAIKAQQRAMEISQAMGVGRGGGNLFTATPFARAKTGLPEVMPYIIWWAAGNKVWNEFQKSQDDEGCKRIFGEYLRDSAKEYGIEIKPDDLSEPLNGVTASWAFAKAIAGSEDSKLRRAKIAAFYLVFTDPSRSKAPGGYDHVEHRSRFWAALSEILGESLEHPLANLRSRYERDLNSLTCFRELCKFIYHVYLVRSADRFSWFVARGLNRLTVTDAVVASANFPPVFAPFELHDIYDPKYISSLGLCDGGIHDNQGVDALLSDEDCTHIIVSDASRALDFCEQAPSLRSRMLNRIMSLLQDRVRFMQLTDIRQARRSNNSNSHSSLRAAAFFHISQDPAAAPSPLKGHKDALAIAALRTDLDIFNVVEMKALIYQGYQLCDRFVRRYFDHDTFKILGLSPPDDPQPFDNGELDTNANRILAVGKLRIFRTLALVFGRVTGTKAALGVLVGFVILWFFHDSVIASSRSLFTLTERFWRYSPAPYIGSWMTSSRLGLSVVLLMISLSLAWSRLYSNTRAWVSSKGGWLNTIRAKMQAMADRMDPVKSKNGQTAAWILALVRTSQEGRLHWSVLSLLRGMRKLPRYLWFVGFGILPLILMAALSLFGCFLALDAWLFHRYVHLSALPGKLESSTIQSRAAED